MGTGVFLNGQPLVAVGGWTITTVPLENSQLSSLEFGPAYVSTVPAFYRGVLTVDVVADTFLQMQGWGKGLFLGV